MARSRIPSSDPVSDAAAQLPPSQKNDARINVKTSKSLGAWLRDRNVTIVVSSYQSGLLFTIGSSAEGEVRVGTGKFRRSMGLAVDKNGLSVGTLDAIVRFTLVKIETGQEGSLHFLVPTASFITGFVNCHDLGRPAAGGTLFVSSLFNSVGLSRGENGFTPLWRPPFISDFVPEDRCHLNGLAMDGGRLRYVTALGQGNTRHGWRDDLSAGVVLDVQTNSVIASNLWMPHSPRMLKGELWLLESGKGSFGRLVNGKLEERLACPGFARGLDFHEGVAAIGISKPRVSSVESLPILERMRSTGLVPKAGVLLFDVASGRTIHSVEFSSPVDEIYDVAFFPGSHDVKLIQPGSKEMSRIYCINLPNQAGRQQSDTVN